MRKSMKKVLATTCVAGLCVSALAGCTSTPKTSSMTEVMNVASELDSYSYSYEVDITTESEGSMSMELYGNCTKDAVSMSVKIKSIDIEDMDLDYEIRWYRYDITKGKADNYSGVGWNSIETKTFKDYEITFTPDAGDKTEEKIKAIVLKGKTP